MKAQRKIGKTRSETGKIQSEFPRLCIRLFGAWKSLAFSLVIFFIAFLLVPVSKKEG